MGRNRLLVVDDNTVYRSTIGAFFSENGFEIFEAGNGKQGLDLVKKEKFSLLITDLEMPEMDGMQLIEQIRTFDSTLPIVLNSGGSALPKLSEVSRFAPISLIQKPASMFYFLGSVRAVMEQSHRLIAEAKASGEMLSLTLEKTRKMAEEMKAAQLELKNTMARIKR